MIGAGKIMHSIVSFVLVYKLLEDLSRNQTHDLGEDILAFVLTMRNYAAKLRTHFKSRLPKNVVKFYNVNKL